MSENWQAGDLAVCVAEGDWLDYDTDTYDSIGPTVGLIYCVVSVGYRCDCLTLDFAEWPRNWFNAEAFRKIVPDKHEDCEPEFVTLLKRIKRKQVA